MELIIPRPGESLTDVSKRCDAMYDCLKEDGVRIGPLVFYAGKYEAKVGQQLNFVGDVYFNYAMIEQHPAVGDAFAGELFDNIHAEGLMDSFDTVCGIPDGGRTLGQDLARLAEKRFVYVGKKPIPTEPGKKQEYAWDLSRFQFEPGERVVLVEDICNNMQNTENTLAAIAATGAKVVLLTCALNRSLLYDKVYTLKSGPFAGQAIPIIAAIRRPYAEYKQDDPEVAADVVAGNVEKEVKKNWPRLKALSA